MVLALGLGGIVLALVLVFLFSGRRGPASGKRKKKKGAKPSLILATAPQARHCPLCGSPLNSGERVKSDLVRGGGDSIMRIFGCPHCWPTAEAGLQRHCPVCGASLAGQGHAVARYFEKPGRKHVHVLGCTECRGPGARRY